VIDSGFVCIKYCQYLTTLQFSTNDYIHLLPCVIVMCFMTIKNSFISVQATPLLLAIRGSATFLFQGMG